MWQGAAKSLEQLFDNKTSSARLYSLVTAALVGAGGAYLLAPQTSLSVRPWPAQTPMRQQQHSAAMVSSCAACTSGRLHKHGMKAGTDATVYVALSYGDVFLHWTRAQMVAITLQQALQLHLC